MFPFRFLLPDGKQKVFIRFEGKVQTSEWSAAFLSASVLTILFPVNFSSGTELPDQCSINEMLSHDLA